MTTDVADSWPYYVEKAGLSDTVNVVLYLLSSASATLDDSLKINKSGALGLLKQYSAIQHNTIQNMKMFIVSYT